ncbi:MAG TPA: molybdopterin molybdenumtransferase MoeA [Bacteroides sp.]|nr:molybdopterin molybdenumtransferase MoeA [Bacteroides sp.]
MISLDEAIIIIEENRLQAGKEKVRLNSALFRILAEDIVATRDLPPFNKAAMDGYACRREDLGKLLSINESVPAGAIPRFAVESGTCTEIMTGAKVPDGADCVIKQEETAKQEDGKVIYKGKETGNNICYTGEDIQEGNTMLKKGSLLFPQNLGIIASSGRKIIDVFSKINVGLISTGSELVDPGEIPLETSIMNSNAWQLMGQVEATGHNPVYFGIVKDDFRQIQLKVKEALETCDVLVLTGGASVGAYDLVNEVVESLGFSTKFQKLAIQPGKPVSFASRDEKFCFGLSGNPVSCFLQFELLVKHFLYRISGGFRKPLKIKATLGADFKRKKKDRAYFLPVKTNENGFVVPLNYHGSAHLLALKDLDGFAEIPLGVDHLNTGEEVYVRFL